MSEPKGAADYLTCRGRNGFQALENMYLNPLRRIWCIFELFHALDARRPLVVKLGRAKVPKSPMSEKKPGRGFGESGRGGRGGGGGGGMHGGGEILETSLATPPWHREWHREWAHGQVQALAESIDVLAAEATKPEDKETIQKDLQLEKKAGRVNSVLKNAVWNAYTTRGQAAFHYAVQGSAALGWALNEKNVNLEATNPEGWTAMHSAAYSGHPQIVEALLHPIAYNKAEDDGGGQWNTVGKKKSSNSGGGAGGGAEVNVRDKKGRTPAFSSAWQGSLACIELLVAAGADLRLCDIYGYR